MDKLDVQFREVLLRPLEYGHSEDGDTALMLYDDSGDGPFYAVVPTPDTFEHWFEYGFNEEARQALEQRLADGWFAVGVNSTLTENDVFDVDYHGLEQGGTFRPRLVVEYAPAGVGEDRVEAAGPILHLAPNPLAGNRATLRYSLPKAGAANISVFDVTGRSVLSRSVSATRSGTLSLDVRSLAAGICLVRFDTDQYTATSKLVVQR